MPNTTYIDAEDFINEDFLKDNILHVEGYAWLRARSVQSHLAFRRVFGSVNCGDRMHEKIMNLECSTTYMKTFAETLKKTPIDKILNAKRAVHAYLDLAFNPNTRDSSKVAALKEATVLAGITEIDENGRTRLGGLSDFYAAQAAAPHAPPVPPAPVPDEPHSVH
jgi:hypothetical protein